MRILRKVLTAEIYRQYARKKSRFAFNRGREESVGNDDVFLLFAPVSKGPLR